jgi:hypothetical protein
MSLYLSVSVCLCLSCQQVSINSLRTSGYVRPVLTFNNSTFCPHIEFMCFVLIWEHTAIISLYSINWLVYIPETECLLRGTDGVFLYIIQVMCFVWIWEQTATISLYSTGFYNRDGVCLLRGTDWMFIYNSGYVFCVDLRTNSDYFPIQHWFL